MCFCHNFSKALVRQKLCLLLFMLSPPAQAENDELVPKSQVKVKYLFQYEGQIASFIMVIYLFLL